MLPPDSTPPPPPPPPDDLGPVGRRWWATVWAGGARWLDPSTDVLLVELVCHTRDRIDEVEHIIEESGRYYSTKAGQLLPHPALADLRAMNAQCASWLAALSFTPSDRAALGVHVEAEADPLRDYRRRSATLRVCGNVSDVGLRSLTDDDVPRSLDVDSDTQTVSDSVRHASTKDQS